MKHQFSKILSIFCLVLATGTYAQLKTGDQSPNPELSIIDRNSDQTQNIRLYDYKQDAVLLVAFVPSITDKTNYANVLTGSFDTYFAQGMAFPTTSIWGDRTPREDLKILIIT